MNLRIVAKEDLPLLVEWFNNPEFSGEYNPLEQESRSEIEKKLIISVLGTGVSLLKRKMEVRSVV